MKTVMVIFQFDAIVYCKTDIEKFSYEKCKEVANSDKENVIKFSGDHSKFESWLNDNLFDIDNSFYRVFYIEAKFL